MLVLVAAWGTDIMCEGNRRWKMPSVLCRWKQDLFFFPSQITVVSCVYEYLADVKNNLSWMSFYFNRILCMIDRCRQAHQSGPAGGGDGRRRDDQDHLGVHQRKGDNKQTNKHWCASPRRICMAHAVWIAYFYITDWHVDVRGGLCGRLCMYAVRRGGASEVFHSVTGWLPLESEQMVRWLRRKNMEKWD